MISHSLPVTINTTKMSFLALPNELILLITRELDDVRELNGIATSNRRLYALLNESVYDLAVKNQCVIPRAAVLSGLMPPVRYFMEAIAKKHERHPHEDLEDDSTVKECRYFDEPLFDAAAVPSREMVELFMSLGANPNYADNCMTVLGRLAIYSSSRRPFVKWEDVAFIAEKLIKNDATLTVQSRDPNLPKLQTPLYLAVLSGCPKMVELLLDWGANVMSAKLDDKRPSQWYPSKFPAPEPEIMRLLVEAEETKARGEIRTKKQIKGLPYHSQSRNDLEELLEELE